jgi:4-hydroxybenzoate polyprenyltransferase
MNGKLLLKKFVDILLYSNLWIALCAVAMCLQTQLLLFGELRWEPLLGFVFFATTLLYVLHRLISLKKVQPFMKKGRFQIIAKFRCHLLIYAGLAALAGSWFFFQLDRHLKWALILPCLLSLGYVVPFLGDNKRLRDLDLLKIFLLAVAWSWITAGLPAASRHWALTAPALLMALERLTFVFALTLPFDIRDLNVDAYTQVKTIPARFGLHKTKILSAAVLLSSLGFAWLNYYIDVYDLQVLLTLAASLSLTFLLTFFSDRIRHDYYFAGLLDGMMILQFVLVWIVH